MELYSGTAVQGLTEMVREFDERLFYGSNLLCVGLLLLVNLCSEFNADANKVYSKTNTMHFLTLFN